MSYNNKMDFDFVHYITAMVNLDVLESITKDLDEELKDSQLVMNDIKGMIDSLPGKSEVVASDPGGNGLLHEDISNFLSSGTPKLLMPDMENDIVDIDLDNVIATMKSYTEDLKKNLTVPELPAETSVSKMFENLDLEPYANSLDQLSKRLSKLKFNKDEENKCNAELEAKLSLLCDDVTLFTKMVGAKKSLSEANQNWTTSQQKNDFALEYDNLINKLLSGINEVSYLLQNKN